MTKIRVWRAPAIERRIIRNKGHGILKSIQDRYRQVPDTIKIRVWRATQKNIIRNSFRGGTSNKEEEGQEFKGIRS